MVKRIFLLLSLMVFAFGLVSYIRANAARTPKPSKGSTIYYQEHEYHGNEPPVLTRISVRLTNAVGQWVEHHLSFGPLGQVARDTTRSDERGVFKQTDKSLVALGHSAASAGIDLSGYGSISFLRSSPDFVRESEVAGLKTYVWRNSGSTEGEFFEFEYAPETGPIALRIVIAGPEGRIVTEAVNISLGEPSENVFTSPDLPISLEGLDYRIEQAQEQATMESYKRLRQSLVK